MLFKELDLSDEVLDGIRDLGFNETTQIQEQAIPVALQGKNLLGTSYTGSGKTAAFVIPIIDKIFKSEKSGIQALVLAPTRELAQQIDEQFWGLGYHAGISSACVYGGSDWSVQEKAMKAGVNVVVATPGRLLDQMKITTYDFSNLNTLVLDEADRMLDMGFLPDVRNIINRLPKERQTLLFSATVTPRIENIAKEFTDGTFDRIKVGRIAPAKGIEQVYYKVSDSDKKDLLIHLYKEQQWHSALVFASTKRGVDILTRSLNKMGVAVESIHGDKDQKEREATLSRFRSGKVKVLIATDVMARGIDVDDISHIINFDVPNDLDDYIHRIGRTARAESTGNAVTFVSRRDWRAMLEIIDAKDLTIREEEVPEGIGKSDRNEQRSSGKDDSKQRGSSSRGSSRSSAPKQSQDTSPDTAGQKQTQKADKSDDENKPKRKQRPRGRKPNRKPTDKNKSAQGSDASSSTDSPSSKKNKDDDKPPKSTRPRKKKSARRPSRKGNKPDTAGEDSSSKKAEKDTRNKKQGRKQEKGNKPKEQGSDKKKYFRKQEKLIEQVQQSKLPKSDKSGNKTQNESGKQKGVWGKIKKLFS